METESAHFEENTFPFDIEATRSQFYDEGLSYMVDKNSDWSNSKRDADFVIEPQNPAKKKCNGVSHETRNRCQLQRVA
jgi:hypothetical protein